MSNDAAFAKWWTEYRGFCDPFDGATRAAWNAGATAAIALLLDAERGSYSLEDVRAELLVASAKQESA